MMLNKPKILFLDDDYLLLRAVELITRSISYEFYLCNSVKEARLLLRSTDFQVIFSDYHMPECNGVDFLKESSFFSPKAIRILVSASLSDELGLAALKNGQVHNYFKKPFGKAEFYDIIEQALAKYKEDLSQ
ncbi:MAG: response regulator [Sphingobacteriales bacterium]|nr:response regulator [Sphingobacteriales bacterium]